jgi:hypothetical protein
MPFYAVPIVQSSQRHHGRVVRRVLGYDQSPHNAVILDVGDPSQASSGLALIWAETDLSDRRAEKVADGNTEPMAVSTRATLSAKLGGRAFKGDPFNQQIADVLKANGLRPQVDGEMPIWLGPGGRGNNRFWTEQTPRVKHSQAFADTFTRANGALDGDALSGGTGTWSSAGTQWNVLSNQASNVTTVNEVVDNALVGTQGDTDSLYSQVDVVSSTLAGGNVFMDIYAAVSSDTSNGYLSVIAKFTTGTGERTIFELTGFTALDTDAAVDSLSGTLKMNRNGSSVEVLRNGAVILGPVTDTSQTSGSGNRYVGFGLFTEAPALSAALVLDNYLGGDITNAAKYFALLGVG